MQTTSDPVTTGIEKRLGWLDVVKPLRERRTHDWGPSWSGYGSLRQMFFSTGVVK